MSAYLVNLDTLELLASVATRWRVGPHECGVRVMVDDGQEGPLSEGIELARNSWGGSTATFGHDDGALVVRELYLANVRSLAAHYEGDWQDLIGHTIPEGYRFREVIKGHDARIQDAIGAVLCYRYQACEHPAWTGSFAEKLTDAIIHQLLLMSSDSWEYVRPAGSALVVSLLDMAGGAA